MNQAKTITIPESGMSFGPYPEEDLFHIEQSQIFTCLGQGVKMAEFVLLLHRSKYLTKMLFIEAKMSTPDPSNPNKQEAFPKFIQHVATKFSNSFSLTIAAMLERHTDNKNELPVAFRRIQIKHFEFQMILVLKDHPDSALPPIHEALSSELKTFTKVWALKPTSVLVLNEKSARKLKLVK